MPALSSVAGVFWSVCSLALHEVPKGLEKRCLDASDFSRWGLIYLNRVANMAFEKKGCQLIWLLLLRVNSEFLHFSSLVLKCCASKLVPSPYRNSCRVQNTGRKLGCCLAYSLSSSHTLSPGFTLFLGISSIYSLLGGFFTFVAFAGVVVVFSIVAAVWSSALQYFGLF